MKSFVFVTLLALAPQAFAETRAESNVQPQEKAAASVPKHRNIKYLIIPKKTAHPTKISLPKSVARPMGGEICMPDANTNCQPADEGPEIVFREINAVLGGVTIEGTAYDDGWVTICQGAECGGFEIPEIQEHREEVGWIRDTLIEWSGVRDAKLVVCSSPGAQGTSDTAKLISNQTSEATSDPETRRTAARTAWNLSPEKLQLTQEIAGWGNWFEKWGYAADSGYTVTITYSDGGTEQFKFAIYSGDGELTPIAGSLKPGSGTSGCPK